MPKKSTNHVFELSFSDGIYLDFWSVVHLLSGIILGLVFVLLNISLYSSLLLSLGLAALYEIWEIFMDLSEDVQNVITDILLVVSGTYLLIVFLPNFSHSVSISILVFLILIQAVLVWVGWKSYLERQNDSAKHSQT